MRSTFSRLLLAGILGLAVTSSLVRADTFASGDAAPATGKEIVPASRSRITPEELLAPDCPTCSTERSAKATKTGKRRPILDWFSNLGCSAEPETLGCGSLRQEIRFIFGSCRDFFSEPCVKGNDPKLPGRGSSGCNCR